jgi:hypothetical protein
MCSPVSGSTFLLGMTTVLCSAQDAAGNSATSSFAISVRDTIAPKISPPPDQQAVQTGPASAVVYYPAPLIVETGSRLASSGCLPASGLGPPFRSGPQPSPAGPLILPAIRH